jgi:hypothetical protein
MLVYIAYEKVSNVSELLDLPMLRYIAKPTDARGLETDVGIETASHGLMDDGLLLLVQQLDQASLGTNETSDLSIFSFEVEDDLILFFLGRASNGDLKELFGVEPQAR